jgi:hypothetical protein
MSRDDVTQLMQRGAGNPPAPIDVDELWASGRRHRRAKRILTTVVTVTVVSVATVIAADGWMERTRADIGPVIGAPSPMVHDVGLPDPGAEPDDLGVLSRPTGSIVVAVRDGAAEFVTVDTMEADERMLPELAAGDPLFRIVDGDRLVLYGGDTVYAMDPRVDAQPEPITELGSFAGFVPSGVPDRVWLQEGRTAGQPAEVRQIDVTGRTIIGPSLSPGANLVLGLRDKAILQGDSGLVVWNPATDTIVQEVDGPFPMGTDGTRFAWCDQRCQNLYLSDPGTGDTELVATLPDGFSFGAYYGRISPDGRFLATPVCADGPQDRCALAVLDLRGNGSWTVADGRVAGSPAPAWSPDGAWVFAPGPEGQLVAYRPGDNQASLVPGQGLNNQPLGLGVIAAPPTSASALRLPHSDVQAITAAATHDPSLKGHVVADSAGLASVWQMADVIGTPPQLPDGTIGVFVIARQAESTCRSTDDVVGVEIDNGQVIVLLDPDGQFTQPCPGPLGSHAYTAFVVAIPDTFWDQLGGADIRLAR